MKKLNKSAVFSDIHFGKKSNSESHNQDCLDFIGWFCDNVRSDPQIDNILFLGDWNENRSALNISTLNYSYRGAKMINDLNLPVYFVIGNHDLYHRHTREIHSVIPFNEFGNFTIIEEPTVLKHIGDGVLMCPYMFHAEYPSLSRFLKVPFWAGHFEFRGFEITGYGVKMPTGPNHQDFKDPNYIVSGHFHKRQAHENVVYVGNTFPMDFGDAGDTGRGMMTYDHIHDEMLFYDWEECPKYVKTSLTDILDNTIKLHPNSRVKCLVDIPISFEESNSLRNSFTSKFELREFTLKESTEIQEALTDTNATVSWAGDELLGVNELVERMLKDIESDHIDNERLTKIYKRLKAA